MLVSFRADAEAAPQKINLPKNICRRFADLGHFPDRVYPCRHYAPSRADERHGAKMTREALFDTVAHFDKLPDDGILCAEATELLLGGTVTKRQLRRDPPIPRRQLSKRRYGFRVGDIRKLIRGELQPAA
jgi:hypothetical protein